MNKPALNMEAAGPQEMASRPEQSAFVPANAGAGKTHVLVSRVIRLLLNGVKPERILCLTYTRAAAAEMSSRLFDKLSGWIALDDTALKERILLDTGQFEAADVRVEEARRLFTMALETPGGLKVQTIHAFCERLLQRFPIEAGVVPGFKVLSEQDSRDLMNAARAEVLVRGEGNIGRSVSILMRFTNEHSLPDLLKTLNKHGRKILQRYGGSNELSRLEADLEQVFGVAPGDTETTIIDALPGAVNSNTLQEVASLMATSTGKVNPEQASLIEQLLAASDPKEVWVLARKIVTNASGSLKADSKLVAGSFSNDHPECLETLLELKGLVSVTLDKINALTIKEATVALVHFGQETIKTFKRLKVAHAAYDFEDLVHQTVDLLSEKPDAAWVLYKLDGGIDHILLDEAQDTSPEQWNIINALTEEFFAGDGARPDTVRTVFAVGDRKQSIYSFQGAQPEQFDAMQQWYEARIRDAGSQFEKVELSHSFRSSRLILEAVDRVFKHEKAKAGVVSGLQPKVQHRDIGRYGEGLVEIWDLEVGNKDGEVDHFTPKRPLSDEPPHMRMAERIAETIRSWLKDSPRGMLTHDTPIKASDILILVRQRSYLMAAIVRKLKEKGVAVAGADRLKLLDHVAVQDLMALAQASILPRDDLSLACLLKSPLVTQDDGVSRFTDEELFELCHDRGTASLWQQLNAAVENGRPFLAARDRLLRWRSLAERTGVYEFFSTVLARGRGRQAMLGALGLEAADPIDAFTQLAIDYEAEHTPSLAGFLAWLEETQAEIKRDMDQAGGEVRVMTVHGAKGLEAPIVFLPDTCSVPDGKKTDKVLMADEVVPVWTLKTEFQTALTEELKAGAKNQALREYNRLLYVAMTRARHRLYVCGFVNKTSKDGDPKDDNCWYAMMLAALIGETPLLGEQINARGQRIWRGGTEQVPEVKQESGEDAPARPCEPPAAWGRVQAPPVDRPQKWLAPSRLGSEGDADDGWSSEVALSPLVPRNDKRFRRGILVHRLLQTLPELAPEEREAAARRYLKSNGANDKEIDATIDELTALFTDLRFARVFSGAGRPEVSIAAEIQGPDGSTVGMSGQIDRLLVDEDHVLVVDFKTNRPPPDSVDQVPEIYLRQLAAYSKALEQIYPQKTIECALLWTDAPQLMPIPKLLLDQAWQTSGITTV